MTRMEREREKNSRSMIFCHDLVYSKEIASYWATDKTHIRSLFVIEKPMFCFFCFDAQQQQQQKNERVADSFHDAHSHNCHYELDPYIFVAVCNILYLHQIELCALCTCRFVIFSSDRWFGTSAMCGLTCAGHNKWKICGKRIEQTDRSVRKWIQYSFINIAVQI